MTPTTLSTQQLIQQQPAQLSTYRKRKYQNSAASDNDFSDDESSPKTGSPSVDDDKRAHHNELERRRRDNIKDHFMNLKSSVPLLEGEKSSRMLILKRSTEYIRLLENQVKKYESEVEDLKRRNENLTQQTTGLNLKPFLNSLHFQSANMAAATQPLFNASLAQAAPQHSLMQQTNIPMMPTSTHTSSINTSPTTSSFNQDVSAFAGSLTNGLPACSTTFCQPSSSPQSTSTITTPIPTLQNPNILANISSLLLQNPSLISQLQAQSPNASAFEPLTPPSSASLNGSSDLVDAQTRLLISSLALKERSFINQIAAANL